jgi:hypothetical protein
MRHTLGAAGDSYVFAKDEAGRHPARRDTRGMRFGQARQDLGYGCTLYGRLRYFMAMQLDAVAAAVNVGERMGTAASQWPGSTCARVARWTWQRRVT